MKKLYFLNEEEKQRILNLHKSHQIGKNWLTEQSAGSGVNSVATGAATGAAIGLAAGLFFPPLEVISIPAGAIIGAIVGLVSSISSGMNRGEFNSSVDKACSKTGAGKPTLTGEKMVAIAQKLNDDINTENPYGLGYATEASRQSIRQALLDVPSLPDVCYVMGKYKQIFGISLLDDLTREIYYDENYSNTVRYPLTLAIEKSLDITKQAEEEGTVEVTDPKTGKKMKVPKKDAGTYTSDDETSEFTKTFPCLATIANATKDYKSVYVLKPSDHENIIDMSTGIKTKISEKAVFKNDQNYYLKSKRGQAAGTWQCSEPDAEDVELTPAGAGVGTKDNILGKFPCLNAYNVEPKKNKPNIGEMSDYDRSQHASLSTYPEGNVYFFDNGVFVTQRDYEGGIKKSGTFSCGAIDEDKLEIDKKSATRWEDRERAPVPINPNPKPNAGGMGIVSAFPSYISEILKCAKIGGSTLDQNALNKLYDYIKDNK